MDEDRSLELISECRPDVFLACAGALLHNLGKVSSVFVDMQFKNLCGKYYFFQQIAGLIRERDFSNNLSTIIQKLPATDREKVKKLKKFGGPDDITLDVFRKETRDALSKYLITNLPKPFNDREYRVGDLLEYLGVNEWRFLLYNENSSPCYLIKEFVKSSSHLTHLMNISHHGASGSEKESISHKQQPGKCIGSSSDFKVFFIYTFWV